MLDNSGNVIIFAGSDDTIRGERRYKTNLTKYHIHHNYRTGTENYWDFGIIELEYPYNISTDSEHRYLINTVCLP